jgi:hypothetical protein
LISSPSNLRFSIREIADEANVESHREGGTGTAKCGEYVQPPTESRGLRFGFCYSRR